MSIENLFVPATEYTPEIRLCLTGEMFFKGKSYPENSFAFYQPITEWLMYFLAQAQLPPKIILSIHLVYFNSSTAKQIFDFFKVLSEQYNRSEVVIRWIYDTDNENALEEGQGLASDFPTLIFELIEISSPETN
jgi:hypothetical protein